MDKNAKILSVISFFIIILGLGLIFWPISNLEQKEIVPETFVLPTQATSSGTFGVAGQSVKVIKVVDGDTIIVEGDKTIRFIGIDTPETVDPRRPVGCFGKEASNKAKELMNGKSVILEKDVSETDTYQRLLRYVYLPLPDGSLLFVNDYLVREGFAKVLTYPPDVKFDKQFLDAQKQAQEEKRGLWDKC